MARLDDLQGKRVKITATTNPHAAKSVGQTGVVSGYAPDGTMVRLTLDNGTVDFWALPHNLEEVR